MAGSVGAGEAADATEPHTDARIVTTNLDESSDLAKVIRPPTDDPSQFSKSAMVIPRDTPAKMTVASSKD